MFRIATETELRRTNVPCAISVKTNTCATQVLRHHEDEHTFHCCLANEMAGEHAPCATQPQNRYKDEHKSKCATDLHIPVLNCVAL